MSQPKLLVEIIRESLKPRGFKQRADTWYRETNELFQVLNLQKSDFSRQYYINIAFWLKSLGGIDIPREHLCQIRDRWESLITDSEGKDLERLLNLDDGSILDDERKESISRLLEDHILPLFQRYNSLDALKKDYQSGALPLRMITVQAQQSLCDSKQER